MVSNGSVSSISIALRMFWTSDLSNEVAGFAIEVRFKGCFGLRSSEMRSLLSFREFIESNELSEGVFTLSSCFLPVY